MRVGAGLDSGSGAGVTGEAAAGASMLPWLAVAVCDTTRVGGGRGPRAPVRQ